MSFIKRLFGLLLLALVSFSCSNDVDLYADYKDISIVYSIMDSSDDTTWIKITKAFVGPGNALISAQNPDSSNYNYKLDVKLEGIQNGVSKQEITFDTITIKSKKIGDTIFYYPKQLAYYTTEILDADYKYELIVNKDEGSITATSGMVDDFSISYPNRYINFMSDKDIEWNSASNGKRYEVTMVFNYRELLPGSTDTTDHTISYYLGMRKATNLNGGEDMYIGYVGDVFYSTLENELDVVLNIKRWTGDVDVIIASASQEFDTYLEVNEGLNSLLSEVPIYTNVEGGIGIFASRKTMVRSVQLSVQSEQKLVQEYPELGFMYKN